MAALPRSPRGREVEPPAGEAPRHRLPYFSEVRPSLIKEDRMNRRMIWVGDDEYAGWCCSECSWSIVVPHLDSMVAALAFNRVAQEEF